MPKGGINPHSKSTVIYATLPVVHRVHLYRVSDGEPASISQQEQ